MTEEYFFSGYCRETDGSRTVCAEVENGTLESVDCGFEGCCHAGRCAIGKKIRELTDSGRNLRGKLAKT